MSDGLRKNNNAGRRSPPGRNQNVQLVAAADDLMEGVGRAQPDATHVEAGQRGSGGPEAVSISAMAFSILPFLSVFSVPYHGEYAPSSKLCRRRKRYDELRGRRGLPVRANANLEKGEISAMVEIGARPERVFQALASEEIRQWWVRPGVFDTRQWSGDVRVGGRWEAAGVGKGLPYRLEGEFLEVEPPTRLAHTWRPAGAPGNPTVVTYLLEALPQGTRLTLRHSGFASREVCANTSSGWETSLQRLAQLLAPEGAAN